MRLDEVLSAGPDAELGLASQVGPGSIEELSAPAVARHLPGLTWSRKGPLGVERVVLVAVVMEVEMEMEMEKGGVRPDIAGA